MIILLFLISLAHGAIREFHISTTADRTASGHQEQAYATQVFSSIGSHSSQHQGSVDQARHDYEVARTVTQAFIDSPRVEKRFYTEDVLSFELKSTGSFKDSLEPIYRGLFYYTAADPRSVEIRDLGLNSVKLADQSFVSGEWEDAQFFKSLGNDFLEILLGLNPVTGIPQCSYELLLGKSFISGHELSSFQRGLAFAGIVTFGAPRTVAKLGALMGKMVHFAADKTHVLSAIQRGTHFLTTHLGKVFSKVRRTHIVQDDEFRHWHIKPAGTALNYPENEMIARIVPRELAEDIRSGKIPLSKGKEAFVTVADDIVPMSKNKLKLAHRVSLFEDENLTILRNLDDHVIITFPLERKILSNFEKNVEGNHKGFIDLGYTRGGAREYVTHPNMLQDLLESGILKPENIKIIRIGD